MSDIGYIRVSSVGQNDARQLEGIAAAKKKGKHLDRASSLDEDQKKELIAMVDSRNPKTEVAKHFGISRQTLYNVLKTLDHSK
ncbi:MAG: helix-turn-helix domain-containing protein [Deltaproteobacteria bacterium]|nr:helix-turn-helix domain-containing protein [Deltaproteobacteria bacterium]